MEGTWVRACREKIIVVIVLAALVKPFATVLSHCWLDIGGAATMADMNRTAQPRRAPVTSAVSYAGYRFPPDVISDAVWLYYRFPLSLRMVEELLAARGIELTYETVRRWAMKFGLDIARRIRSTALARGDKWQLDEVEVTINGKKHWLWRGSRAPCKADSGGTYRYSAAARSLKQRRSQRFRRQVQNVVQSADIDFAQ
jgi:hypothetical protein